MSENLNLQTIKLEPAPSTPPEDKTQHDIKAKLQSHVKRRLHEYGQNAAEDGHSMETHTNAGGASTLSDHKKDSPKEVRQKRPYHKRTDKVKDATSAAPQQHRKYKQKMKQQAVVSDSHDDNSMPATSNTISGTISAGDEDEAAGHDNDMRTNREKEKCPDVLAMVLSMKKRALMQDPEVQKFLADIMNVIKS
ncbi:uncharacterized protein LOC101890719 [Musca domestica]|uniref:Uncharacterized protein LOC101890719 n=1 Tax=Musca domestica TaxID=7370 RepID=A0A9J7CWI6_MUSDO|nr:uncharacterized protein LOC101890719 [Musca domestica]